MSVKTNNALANQLLNGVFGGAAGVNFNSATMKFYTGAQPATADTAATGTLVATITLPASTAFTTASGAGRSVSLNSTPLSANAGNAGTIGYCRITDSGATYVIDCDVTLTGGGGTITVDNTTLTSGQQLQVTSLTIID